MIPVPSVNTTATMTLPHSYIIWDLRKMFPLVQVSSLVGSGSLSRLVTTRSGKHYPKTPHRRVVMLHCPIARIVSILNDMCPSQNKAKHPISQCQPVQFSAPLVSFSLAAQLSCGVTTVVKTQKIGRYKTHVLLNTTNRYYTIP